MTSGHHPVTIGWFWGTSKHIFLKAKMEAENHSFAKETHLPNLHFGFNMLIFRGYIPSQAERLKLPHYWRMGPHSVSG